MKRFLEYIDAWPHDWHGAVTFAPPTFWENVTGAAVTLLLLIVVFSVIALFARFCVWLWDRREGRRSMGFVRRVM